MWYYVTDSNQRKQAHADELPLLEVQGKIKPSTLMWTEGMADWQPASEVLPELFDAKPEVNLPQIPQHLIKSDVVDYDILGDDMQIVEVELDPGEVVIAEAGAMNYVEEGITFDTRMGDGSDATEKGIMGILKNVGSRVLTGESIFMTHFTHEGQGKKRVAFAAPYPGKIIPVDLSQVGGELICQKDSFLCAARGTKLSIAFNKKFGAGLFGGEGFILQRLQGDGMAFVHAGGTVVKKELKGETLRVDTGCLVAFAPTIDYDIERAGNLKSMIFGGEGLFLATLKGHGTVYLQSLPFARLADRIAGQIAPGGRRQGEGSLLGGVGNLLDGDGR
ncbi:MAG: TIGR00266 family protein [Aquisalinus sp.]|nr:TIGR00266 family protein [Aquisalinus sp.]